jgi:methyl-accepting chemotaxis protein
MVKKVGYLDFAGVFWRSLGPLLVFQAVGWALAAGLAYLIADPALAKNYYTAHQSVRETWKLLLPALAAAAGVGFLLVGVGTGLLVWRYSRRLRRPLYEVDGVLRRLAAGQLPAAPAVASKRPGAAEEVVEILAPLGDRVQSLQRVSKEIQKSVLALNYKASGTAELTLKDLRELAGRLDALAKELDESVHWFET